MNRGRRRRRPELGSSRRALHALNPHLRVSTRRTAALVCSLALLTTSACGENNLVQGPGPAAEVTISPSSHSFDALGETHQFMGGAVDADGVVVDPGPFSWESQDTTVASVSTTGRVTAVGNGVTSIQVAISSGLSASATVRVEQVAVALEVQAPDTLLDALGADVQLTISAVDRLGGAVSGGAVGWSSSDEGVAVVSGSGLVSAVANGSAFIRAASGETRDSIGITVRQRPTEVVVTPAFRLIESPGDTFTVSADVVDRLGNPVAGSSPVWSSSDEAVATVTEAGLVTTVGGGSAGIFAVVDPLDGAAALTVGMATDWSAAGEWRTYQGDQVHSGYVPVNLDVGVFTEAWSAAPVTGSSLNPVTVEGGAVAFSTSGGARILGVMEGSSGATRWTYDLGDISSVHPPAIYGGTVYATTGGHGDSYLWAFDGATGDSSFAAPFGNQWSRYYAPVVVDGAVYMAGGYYGGMYRFDASTGEEHWFFGTNQYDQWSPAVVGGEVYAYTGEYSPAVQIVDAGTGTEIASIPDPGFDWNGWSMGLAPVVTGEGRLLAAQGGRLLAFDLAGRLIAWEVAEAFGGQVSSGDGLVFVVNGSSLEARAEADGSLLWGWDPPDEEQIRSPFIVTRNVVLVATSGGTHAVHVGARRSVWRTDRSGALALARDGGLYLVQGGTVTRIDVR